MLYAVRTTQRWFSLMDFDLQSIPNLVGGGLMREKYAVWDSVLRNEII